jgi:hypothetical protein
LVVGEAGVRECADAPASLGGRDVLGVSWRPVDVRAVDGQDAAANQRGGVREKSARRAWEECVDAIDRITKGRCKMHIAGLMTHWADAG